MANYRDEDPPEVDPNSEKHHAAIDPIMCKRCGQTYFDPILRTNLCMPALNRSTGGEIPSICPRGYDRYALKDPNIRNIYKGGSQHSDGEKRPKVRREGNVIFIE